MGMDTTFQGIELFVPASHAVQVGCFLWGAVRKKLYRRDLAQKLLSLCLFSYLCAHLAISARIWLYLRRDSYLYPHLAISAQR